MKSDDFWTEDDVRFGRTLPRSSYNYGRDIREGLDSNVVMSPVAWIMRVFTESDAIVESRHGGRWRRAEDHPLELRLEQPNPFHDGDALTKATITSYCLDGNAYWLKVRNGIGDVVELWYVPHWLISPKWPRGDTTTFISHYEYRPGGRLVNLPPRDVVHFRFGLDPRDTRMGYSPLRPLLREVFTDEEAANFSAAILRNMGVPGLIVSPKDAASAQGMTREKAEAAKQRLIDHFTRDRRGEPFVATAPTEIAQFGFDPNQLMLGNLRDIAEERVCAMLGLPAAVVGFGAGLQQTKVGATMEKLVQLARVACINPMARSFGKTLKKQLLPDYVSQLRQFRIRYDMSEVSVFQEDETAWQERVIAKVQGGVLRVDQAQELLDIEIDATQNVYLRDSRFVAVPANKDPVAPPPAQSDNGGPPASEGEEADEEEATRRF